MWVQVLSAYAAIVSTASLTMSYLSYRAGGPQLSGDAYFMGRLDIQGPTLHVNLHNKGRGPITVRDLFLWGFQGEKNASPSRGWPLRPPENEPPIRLEGHSGEHWAFPGHDLAKDWLNAPELTHLQVYVSLADGRALKLPVETENIDVLDGGNLPDWQPDYFKDWPRLPEKRPKPHDQAAEVQET